MTNEDLLAKIRDHLTKRRSWRYMDSEGRENLEGLIKDATNMGLFVTAYPDSAEEYAPRLRAILTKIDRNLADAVEKGEKSERARLREPASEPRGQPPGTPSRGGEMSIAESVQFLIRKAREGTPLSNLDWARLGFKRT